MNLRSLFLIVFLLQTSFLPRSLAAREGGNGGNDVRATFIRMGNAVIRYLRSHPNGLSIVGSRKLKVEQLESFLSPDYIHVVEKTLHDNTGSLVDEVGIPNDIKLVKSEWKEHFDKSRDVYYLVFHALLRGAGISDDGYVISDTLFPFPTSYKISQINPQLFMPNGGEEKFSQNIFDLNASTYSGNGWPSFGNSVEIKFDLETGVSTLNLFRLKDVAQSESRMTIKRSCLLKLKLKTPPRRILVVSEATMIFSAAGADGSQGWYRLDYFKPGESPKDNIEHSNGYRLGEEGSLKIESISKRVIRSNCGEPLDLNILAEAGAPSNLSAENTSKISTSFQIDATYFKVSSQECK